MNLQNYSVAALRTVTLKDRQFNLEHAAFGLMTEAGELADCFKKEAIYGRDLDVVNLKEEIGDCLWYLNLALFVEGLEIDRLDRTPSAALKGITSFGLSTVAVALAGEFAFSVEETPRNRAGALTGMFDLLSYAAERYGFTLEDAADANIAKLNKRYPEGKFSADRALKRNLKAERDALDNA